mgnify:FL=1
MNDQIKVLVGGNPVAFDSAPYIDENDRLMVPLRAIVEALGAKVAWNPDTKSITILKQETTLFFKIDQPSVVVNGQTKRMDTSPVIRNNRTMVPVRYVGEYLGAEVHWDPDAKSVTIN